MSASRIAAALMLQLCLAHTAFAQSARLPMDAGGRPLKNDRHERLEYDSPAPHSTLVNPATLAEPPKLRSTKQQKTLRSRRAGAVLQKTGTSPSYDIVWRTAAFGTGIGATGISSIDADADGDLEIVLGGGMFFGGNAHWSIVDYNEDKNEYEIEWQSAPYYMYGEWTPEITALRAVEFGSTRRVWVGRSDGRIDVVDVLTRETVRTWSASMSEINDFALADANNDGEVEVVALTSTDLHFFDPVTLASRGTVAYGGGRLAVGNVDDDANLETVLDTGYVLEIEGSTPTVQWQAPEAFGIHIGLADFDADGRDELVAAQGWYLIRAWDVEAESLKWSYDADLDIGAMRLIDVTDDGVAEVVYGDNQWGAVHVLDAATQAELWSIPNPEHGTTDVAVFDADGDGELEILWGAGYTSTGPDYLYVHDVATQAFEWQSVYYSGTYQAVDIGDVDADGTLELVVGSYDGASGYGDGILMVFDGESNELEWTSASAAIGSSVGNARALKLANVDTDPQLEIVVGTDHLYDGALYVIDGLTHQIQNDAFYDSGSPLAVLDTADLTGDGLPEVLAGNLVVHTGSPGVFIYVLDPRTDEIVWQSAALATGFSAVSDVEVVDVAAPGADLLAVSSSVHLVRWSDRQHLTSTTSGYQAATAGDVHAEPGNEILAATSLGTIDVLSGATLDVLASYSVCSSSIPAIAMHAANQVVVTCDDSLLIYSLTTQSVVDATPVGLDQLGTNASLVRAVDGGRSIILTGGTEAALFVDLSTNGLPVVTAASASVHWRGTVDLQLTATDPDGDPLHFELASLPARGAATWLDAAQGQLRYTGGGIAVGSDSLLVRVSDGAQYSAAQPITITLTNNAPNPETTELAFHWRGEQEITLSASDPDDDPLSFTLTSGPAHGTATLEATTGVLTFVPSSAYVGADTLGYTISDGSASHAVSIQIALTNTKPDANDAEFTVTRGTMINGRLRATDADDDPLTFSIVDAPEKGTVTFEADTGLFEYVPGAAGTGVDTMTFMVSDGVSRSEATVEFVYSNTPPSAAGGGGGGGGNFGGLLMIVLLPFVRRRLRG